MHSCNIPDKNIPIHSRFSCLMKVEGHLLRIVEPTASAGITSGGFSRISFISPDSITDELDN